MRHALVLSAILAGAPVAHAQSADEPRPPAVVEVAAPAAPAAPAAREGAADEAWSTKNVARATAVADSVSTYAALAAGASELNPLVATSPAGLVLLAGLKFGLVEVADKMPPARRQATLRTYSALWGGVSVSNLMFAAAVAPPVAVAAGLAAGWMLWQRPAERPVPVQRESEPAQATAMAPAWQPAESGPSAAQ